MRHFEVLGHPQRSPEWFAARCGVLTASVAGDVMAKIKSGEAAARRDLRYRLAIERLTGQTEENDLSNVPAVQRGVELEYAARMRFEAERMVSVEQTGFLRHTSLLVGASLDGHVGDFEEVVEIKCPKSSTHIGYFEAGGIPSRYLWQITHQVWLTGAQWASFVSYDDRLPEGLDYFSARAPAKDLPVAEYEAAAIAFLEEVDALYNHLKRKAA